MPNREAAKADVLQGTLDLMVLQTLAGLGRLHGYDERTAWARVMAIMHTVLGEST